MMKIEGSAALVTGANRGLGKAYADALLAAGAAKVYAGARDPSLITDNRLIPVKLDITSSSDVAAASRRCEDVSILINNAGIMLMSPMLRDASDEALRREMEVNVYGLLAMIRAFAPILARNGGGTIANMLSIVSWFVYPFNATLLRLETRRARSFRRGPDSVEEPRHPCSRRLCRTDRY
jgi:NAD(P)-dependent dehydrogenase (short-subunit alcohol dehydrogenase family)